MNCGPGLCPIPSQRSQALGPSGCLGVWGVLGLGVPLCSAQAQICPRALFLTFTHSPAAFSHPGSPHFTLLWGWGWPGRRGPRAEGCVCRCPQGTGSKCVLGLTPPPSALVMRALRGPQYQTWHHCVVGVRSVVH